MTPILRCHPARGGAIAATGQRGAGPTCARRRAARVTRPIPTVQFPRDTKGVNDATETQ
jgi:hypothetical protein